MWDEFDDLVDDYDFFDAEFDALVDEASVWPRDLSGWPRLLGLAEGAVRRALNAYDTGRGPGVVANAIYQGEQTLRDARAEIERITGGARQSSVLEAIDNAIIRLDFARNQLQGISIVPGAEALTSPADSLGVALEWIGHARTRIGMSSVG